MILLAIDGNSILNRAFYGIKLLATKDGRFTNGIYGFLNILLHLQETCSPDAVAVAFDLKAPTFRHKLYPEYKAGRKGMPPELRGQMPVLKEILHAMGIRTVELEGYEADDILGTLSVCGCEHCYIATGDRDSLQLVSDATSVLLTSTKMGRTQTVEYTPEKLMEEYGLTPERMIDLKALMGDSSDNIPGVAGIGPKTATDLLLKCGSLDAVFADPQSLPVSAGVRSKLINGKQSAYLSYQLGTICKTVPIDTAPESYRVSGGDPAHLRSLLTDLEMYKMVERLGLSQVQIPAAKPLTEQKPIRYHRVQTWDASMAMGESVYFLCAFEQDEPERLVVAAGEDLYDIQSGAAEALLTVLRNPALAKYTTGTKQLYRWAFSRDTEMQNVVFDCELAGYLLNPNASDYSVNTAAADHAIACPPIDDVTPDALLCGAAVLPAVAETLLSQIAENEQEWLYREVELPLARVLASMEHVGFQADKEGIEAFGSQLQIRIDSLMSEIYQDAGEPFNLNSPKQLGVILFEKLGLPAKKKTKTGYSTNAEVLEELAPEHPIVEKILEYRTLAKLKSTYCDGMAKQIGEDGRIHSTFNQTETRTGRISSSEPNLQNIPVRSEPGIQMRRFFTAREGCCLADADYSQIELRVLADLADDRAMLESFNNGEDIHTATAAQVFSLPPEMITPALRSRAKAVNFGIVYGIGAFSLAKDIGVARYEADHYIKSYLAHFSGVDRYMKTVIEQAKEKGYAETVFHRRRYLPELSASNAVQRAFGERVARNMPIQGTAADIIKIAMVRVYDRLKQENLQSRLVLQVHDELIVETAPGEEEAVARLLSYEMEHAVQMKVRLVADVHFGKNWFEAKG